MAYYIYALTGVLAVVAAIAVRRWLHRCRFKPVAVQPVNHITLTLALPQTAVLTRCRCGRVDAYTLTGRWTLAELQGRPAVSPAEPEPV